MSVVSAQAATLDFTFSFTNVASGGGIVAGIVRGLTDDATSAASSVEVLSNTSGFGVGEYVGKPLLNLWILTAGNITGVNFNSFGLFNVSPDVTDSSLNIELFGGGSSVGLEHLDAVINVSALTGLTFTPVFEPPTVPLPAAGFLLVGALGGLAALRRRKTA